MPLLGSFCLLFALVLALYCFVVGIIAAVSKNPARFRLAETARRAGMASFVAVFIAAAALVYAAMTDDFADGDLRGFCVVDFTAIFTDIPPAFQLALVECI